MRARAAYAASPQATHRRAEAAAREGDLNALMRALARLEVQGFPPPPAVTDAVRTLTAARYRDGQKLQAGDAAWRPLRAALRATRPSRRHKTRQPALAPLNPYS